MHSGWLPILTAVATGTGGTVTCLATVSDPVRQPPAQATGSTGGDVDWDEGWFEPGWLELGAGELGAGELVEAHDATLMAATTMAAHNGTNVLFWRRMVPSSYEARFTAISGSRPGPAEGQSPRSPDACDYPRRHGSFGPDVPTARGGNISVESCALKEVAEMPSLVAEVMTYNVVAVRQEAEFKEIVAVMHRRRVSAFPVLDAQDRVIGLVSEADLLQREAYPARPSARHEEHRRIPAKADALTAGELMTSPAITITPQATVTEAARVMHGRKVKRLPVIDEDRRLVGIVSRVDLLGVYDRPDAQIRTEITERVIAGDFVLDPREFAVAVNSGVVTISGKVERQDIALSLLEAVWDVAGVVDVRDRLSYPVKP